MRITDWPACERPREKLLERGASALSDAELLAIFLRHGVCGMTAVDLARSLLSHYSGLQGVLGADKESFCQHKGIGMAKYVQLQASLEMSKRFLKHHLLQNPTLTHLEALKQYLSHCLRGLQREIFGVVVLDSHQRMVRFDPLFWGSLSEAVVYPREVVKHALTYNASGVVLVHNHPSGCAEPSQEDLDLTAHLAKVLCWVDVKVVDHVIVGDGQWLSMAECGLL